MGDVGGSVANNIAFIGIQGGGSACESEQEFSSITSLVHTKLSSLEANLSCPSIDVA